MTVLFSELQGPGWADNGEKIGLKDVTCTYDNAKAFVVHVAQAEMRIVKVLRCSQPIQRKSLGVILRNASRTTVVHLAEHVLPVSAALP